jgi:hypothetical protein
MGASSSLMADGCGDPRDSGSTHLYTRLQGSFTSVRVLAGLEGA